MARRRLANKRLEARRKAFDESQSIKRALTLAPGSFTRPGSMNPRKGA